MVAPMRSFGVKVIVTVLALLLYSGNYQIGLAKSQGGLGILEQFESALVDLAGNALPKVVSLSPYVPPSPSILRRDDKRGRPTNSAAGVIVDGKNGFIVTNSHVVRGNDLIQVTFFDGEKVVAHVVGEDEDTDLAVVKVDLDRELPSAVFGDSSKVKVGQMVMAIGNPYGLEETVTFGLVSGLNRENINLSRYEDFIQTDASINPGNSGGALMNIYGEVVGINTAIINYAQNIGFAIPSNTVQSIYKDLVAHGEVRRGWLGVGIESVTDEIAKNKQGKKGEGVYVNSAFEKDPAYKSGIRKGDIILKIGGALVSTPNQLIRMVGAVHPGQKVDLEILRNGKKKRLSVKLGRKEEGTLFSAIPDKPESFWGFDVYDPNESSENDSLVPVQQGVVVSQIIPKSSAFKGGLRVGDLIKSLNGEPVSSKDELFRSMKHILEGSGVSLLVIRDNESLNLELNR